MPEPVAESDSISLFFEPNASSVITLYAEAGGAFWPIAAFDVSSLREKGLGPQFMLTYGKQGEPSKGYTYQPHGMTASLIMENRDTIAKAVKQAHREGLLR